ncbi:MAG: UDP-glucose 4-epimerase GalE [Bdellovibrionaceae bacterium]|nr:UDP-glucose 4-epimerase GalE [Pseudobdellovibrionaceae bacterium]|tara:strand:+ start:1391 stop:2371 length:981 start_codon:yes stop_codon:yes gene_type:complete
MNEKHVLVTGGAGYIGSHTCKKLKEKGYLPVTFDNLSRGHQEAVQFGPFEKGDLKNPKDLNKVFEKYSFHAVMHFAALTYVGESVEKPDLYFENNVIGSQNLIDSCLQFGVNKFIFSSTAATFGNPIKLPINESHPQNPINPYGATKLETEQRLIKAKEDGLFSIILRYFNAAGASEDASIGESHSPETHLIPLIIQAALGQRDSVSIFGNDYDTKDGTCIRDYIHILDLADAHIRSLEKLETHLENNAFNLGNGNGFSVKEVIEKVKLITKTPFEVKDAPKRPGDPGILIADSTRAKEILKWEPQYNSLESIINTAWKWHQNPQY